MGGWANPRPYWLQPKDAPNVDPMLPYKQQQAQNAIKLQGLNMADALLKQKQETQAIDQQTQMFPLQLEALKTRNALQQREMENEAHDQQEMQRHAYEPGYEPNFLNIKNKLAWMSKDVAERKAQVQIESERAKVSKMEEDLRLANERLTMQQQWNQQRIAESQSKIQGKTDVIPDLHTKSEGGHDYLWTGKSWQRLPRDPNDLRGAKRSLVLKAAQDQLKNETDPVKRKTIIDDALAEVGTPTDQNPKVKDEIPKGVTVKRVK